MRARKVVAADPGRVHKKVCLVKKKATNLKDAFERTCISSDLIPLGTACDCRSRKMDRQRAMMASSYLPSADSDLARQ